MVLSSGLQGPSRVSGYFLLCNLLLLLGSISSVSYYESLWWPMYEWCTGMCYLVDFVSVPFGTDFLQYHCHIHHSPSACIVYSHYW